MPIAPPSEATSTAESASAALTEQRVLRLLLVAVSVALVWILLPFYGSVLWAAIIALLFMPLYCWLLPRLRGRRSLAALLTIAAATLIVVLPAVLLSGALARESRQLFELAEFDTVQLELAEALSAAGKFIAAQTLNAGQNALRLLVSVLITLYLAFFLVRDGGAWCAQCTVRSRWRPAIGTSCSTNSAPCCGRQ